MHFYIIRGVIGMNYVLDKSIDYGTLDVYVDKFIFNTPPQYDYCSDDETPIVLKGKLAQLACDLYTILGVDDVYFGRYVIGVSISPAFDLDQLFVDRVLYIIKANLCPNGEEMVEKEELSYLSSQSVDLT